MKYFITYKMLGSEFPDQLDYNLTESKLKGYGIVIYTKYEHDSMGKLHVHYIYESKDTCIFRNKLRVQGYSHWVVPIMDSQAESIIYNYLQKNDRAWFRTNYAF